MAIPAGPLVFPAPVDDVGKPTFLYLDPEGTTWDLGNIDPDLGWFTVPGIKGWGATNYTLTTDKMPRGGVSIRNIHAEEGRLTWPLHVYGETHLEWLQRYRALKRAFLLTVWRNTTGLLRVTRPGTGGAREIEVMYESGLEGEGGDDDWLSSNPVLTLLCPDAYWRSATPVEQERKFQAGATSFFSPYPSVGSAQILGDTVLTNPGDVDAWTEWTITGPATAITATNHTTRQTWTLTTTLAAGDLVTITTKRPTVRGPSNESLINSLNWPTAYLWGLVPGENSVTFDVAGADVGSAIKVTFYPRFEGA